MIIQKVKVENFRLLKNFELDFREDISLLVGKNNCGKTSVLTIMNKLLNSADNRFDWNDFNLDFQKELFEKVFLDDSFSEEEYNTFGIKMQVFIEYGDCDNFANIQKFMMDLNPDNNVVILEFFYCCKEDKFKQLQQDLRKLDIKSFEEFAKFMRKNSSTYFTIQRYSRGFDRENNRINDAISGEINTTDIKKLISFKSIKANREASNKSNDHSLSALSQKYHNLKQSSNTTDLSSLNKAIGEADKALDSVYNGSESEEGIFSEITKSIQNFGNNTNISIRSSIEEKDLLKNNTTLYYENEKNLLPESYNGLGYLNLIGIIFEIETIIAEFHGGEDENSADVNLLFIEEPEAHTHPQLQYIFIRNIKNLIEERKKKGNKELKIQTIITTHSSHIVSECNFDDVRYLIKNNNELVAKNFQELRGKYNSDILAFKFVKQYLTLNRSELFFADKAVIIEGDTERILLSAMMKKIDEQIEDEAMPLLSQNISVIEAGAYSDKFKPLLDFLGIKTLIITDIDGVKTSGGSACRSDDAKFTSNSSLKEFFDLPGDNTQFSVLSGKNSDDKVIDENIRIAYQTAILEYQPRSFEDAFICTNFDYVKSNKDNFTQGLKKRSEFNIISPDYYDLAQNCIDKKSKFAIEILYFDGATDSKSWKVPEYIKEGLEWLRK